MTVIVRALQLILLFFFVIMCWDAVENFHYFLDYGVQEPEGQNEILKAVRDYSTKFITPFFFLLTLIWTELLYRIWKNQQQRP